MRAALCSTFRPLSYLANQICSSFRWFAVRDQFDAGPSISSLHLDHRIDLSWIRTNPLSPNTDCSVLTTMVCPQPNEHLRSRARKPVTVPCVLYPKDRVEIGVEAAHGVAGIGMFTSLPAVLTPSRASYQQSGYMVPIPFPDPCFNTLRLHTDFEHIMFFTPTVG